jgi:DNA-binding transcriptional MocR family regulator
MIDLIQKYISAGPAVKIAAELETLVRTGRVGPDAVLPPVRALAESIGVSPGTAASAYALLRQRGVVITDGRRGTRVIPRPAQREYGGAPIPAGAMDLQVANPDPKLLPDLRPMLRSISAASATYEGPHLDRQLVRLMSARFEQDHIDASNIGVFSGAIPALYRALKVCARQGDKVGVEDPGFNDHAECVRSLGMVPVPIAMDHEGAVPESLQRALRMGVSAVVLSPRFQSPTGAAFTRARASAIRGLFRHAPRVAVLVDDYAGLICDWPYHECRAPETEMWMVVRSFNKVIAPDLRVAVAVGDGGTMDRMRREQWIADGWVSGYLQKLAAAVIADAGARELLDHAKSVYSSRRGALISALAARGVRATGVTGLNVWIPVHDEAAVVGGLLSRGWGVRPGARYRLQSGPGVRVTIARLEERAAERLAGDIAAVLGMESKGP